MLGYRRHRFAKAHRLLTELRGTPESLDVLVALQRLLLNEITLAEGRIRQLKADSRSGNSDRSPNSLTRRIEALRQMIYIWKCFGDAIAFLYMDRFALKHTFYSVEHGKPRQNSGFISDKNGLGGEIACMLHAVEDGIPALLVDLTNTIRYGDVCLMGEADPYLVEVKRTRKLNPRGRKQMKALEQLHGFYENDIAYRFHGAPEVRRAASNSDAQFYVKELNAAITEAVRTGFAVARPEPGLCYLVTTPNCTLSLTDQIRAANLSEPLAFNLNEMKVTRSWAPYYPFTLLIEDAQHLYSFVQGLLYVVVLVDRLRLIAIAEDAGYSATFDANDTEYAFRITYPGSEGHGGISLNLLARIGLECASPESLITLGLEHFDRQRAKDVQQSSPDISQKVGASGF